VAVKEDITEARRNRALLKQLNEELEDRIRERTTRLEAANAELDAFSYSVSHDLRAPLRGIDGFSLALLEEFRDTLGPEGRHYLVRVRAGVQRMGQLIDDLLKLSRFSRGELNRTPLDLTAIAQAVGDELRRGDPERVLDLRVEDGLAASGDPGLVRALLANLLGNAWKYTAREPRAVVEVVRAPLGEGGPAFCVRDNGAGFDMAYVDKLFAPFQRLHSAHEFEGSGIGLALVQRIVHRHGGRVWAEGKVNGGARFYFSLPGS
jgi:light-regulated signal transduction histidine kinase (bacteriophytochrome)